MGICINNHIHEAKQERTNFIQFIKKRKIFREVGVTVKRVLMNKGCSCLSSTILFVVES